MNDDEFIEQQLESRERSKGMDTYREYVLEKIQEHSEISHGNQFSPTARRESIK